MGRAADLLPVAFRSRSGEGAGARAPRVAGRDAVRGGAVRGHEGPRCRRKACAPRAGHGDSRRHDDGRVHGGRPRVVGFRSPPALRTALHRARLPADARAARLPSCERLQGLHRLRRRHRVHARLYRRGLRHPHARTSSAAASRPVSKSGTASPSCCACRRSDSSTTRPASQSASTSTSAADRSRRSATPTGISRCSIGARQDPVAAWV